MNADKQKGFTLIEIAIVLVIIGLLLGGVLKGQELINNARVKSYVTDFRNIPIQLYGYQDRFKALPGDDSLAPTHIPGCHRSRPRPPATLANGVINGAWDTTTNTDESCLYWQHVRLAGSGAGIDDRQLRGEFRLLAEERQRRPDRHPEQRRPSSP